MYKKTLLLISLLIGITTSSYSIPLVKSLKSPAKICRTQGGIERLLQSLRTYNMPSTSCFTLTQANKVEVLGYYMNNGLIDRYYKIYYHNTVHYVRAKDIHIGSNSLPLHESNIGTSLIETTISTSHQTVIDDIPTLDSNSNHTETISKQKLHETSFVPSTVKTYVMPKRKKIQSIQKSKKSTHIKRKKKYTKKKRKYKKRKKHLNYAHKKIVKRKRKKSKIYHCKARSQSATGWAKSIYLQDAKNKAYKECAKRNISPLACFVEICYEE